MAGPPSRNNQAQIREVLTKFPEVMVALLFGSAVHDRLTPASDIDIAVAGVTPLPLELRATLQTRLSLSLSAEIDLVDLQTVSGLILQQALCTGEIIKTDDIVYPALIKKMWFNQADMMPLTRLVQAAHCRRFING